MMIKLMTWFIKLQNRFNESRLFKILIIYVLNWVDDLTLWHTLLILQLNLIIDKLHHLSLYNITQNNHNTYTTNLEKKHYMQDRVNLKNDQTTMNCMSCSNTSSKMIASDVDMSQENNDARLQRSRNNEEKIADIINLLIKTSMLEKKMNKDYL